MVSAPGVRGAVPVRDQGSGVGLVKNARSGNLRSCDVSDGSKKIPWLEIGVSLMVFLSLEGL